MAEPEKALERFEAQLRALNTEFKALHAAMSLLMHDLAVQKQLRRAAEDKLRAAGW